MPGQIPMQAFAIALKHPMVCVGKSLDESAHQRLGPDDVPIIVRGDGIVIFDFPIVPTFAGPAVPGHQPVGGEKIPAQVARAQKQRKEVAYKRLEYMNAWMTGYMAGMSAVQKHGIITPQPLNPSDHLKAFLEHDRWRVYDVNSSYVVSTGPFSNVETRVFDYAIDVMEAASRKFPVSYASSLSLFHQASYNYRIHQFSSAHIAAWSLCELVLNGMWRELQSHVSEGENRLTEISQTRSELLNGRDFTASVVTQILSISGMLSDERREKLDRARKDRNAFAHSLVSIDDKRAANALTAASEMLSDFLGIRVTPQLSNAFWV